MAHITKATRLQVPGLLRHDTRSNDNYSNESIDSSRTELNYNLCGNPFENYDNRMSELYVLNRKDVNTLVEIVITKPKDVSDNEQKAFFEGCLENVKGYFGDKNVISGAVHMDETTPHIHIKAIPVYFNEKKQREQVSFDKVVKRDFYQHFHEKLSQDIEKKLGHKVHILNGETIENKTIKQLKKENIDHYNKAIKEHKAEYNHVLEQEKELIEKHKKRLEATEQPDKNIFGHKYMEYEKYLEAKATIKTLTKENESLKLKQIDYKKEINNLEQDSFNNQYELANLRGTNQYLQKENKKLKNGKVVAQERDTFRTENIELKKQQQQIIKENQIFKTENLDLKKENNILKENNNFLQSFYNTFTDTIAHVFKREGKETSQNLLDTFNFHPDIKATLVKDINAIINTITKVISHSFERGR